MYLCDDGHDEVCYEGKDCPACDMKRRFSDAEDEIFKLKEEIEGLNNQEE